MCTHLHPNGSECITLKRIHVLHHACVTFAEVQIVSAIRLFHNSIVQVHNPDSAHCTAAVSLREEAVAESLCVINGIGCSCCWVTGAVASSLVKQKLQEVILKKRKQLALERTNSNSLSVAPVAYRYSNSIMSSTTHSAWFYFLVTCVCVCSQKPGPRPKCTLPASGLVSVTDLLRGFRRDTVTQSR